MPERIRHLTYRWDAHSLHALAEFEPARTDTTRMIVHDLLEFCALLASGIVGALVATPLRHAMVVVAERNRDNRRN